MKSLLSTLLLLVFFTTSINAEVSYTKQDSLIFEKYKTEFTQKNNYRDLPLNEVLVKTSLFFIDTPYTANTLDQSNTEELVINLREFDCTTFIETCMALSKAIKSESQTFNQFCKELKSIRYRTTNIQDYSSRLHYMSDWIYENQKKGLVNDMSEKLGGMLDDRTINYMSTHASAYSQLKNNPTMVSKIKNTEKNINERKGHYFILKQNINNLKNNINSGEIVLFATSIDGLDYTHMGITYKENGKLTFIHASSKANKVIIEESNLADYCNKSGKNIGISILNLK